MLKLRKQLKSFYEDTKQYEGLEFEIFRQLNSKYGDTFEDSVDDGRIYYIRLLNVPKNRAQALHITDVSNIVLARHEEIYDKSILINGQLV